MVSFQSGVQSGESQLRPQSLANRGVEVVSQLVFRFRRRRTSVLREGREGAKPKVVVLKVR